MLKIKDNVDLKELEKFGFNRKIYDCIGCNSITTWDYHINISPETKMIWIEDAVDGTRDYCDELDSLYDLIQAGLVEKVEVKYGSKHNSRNSQ